MTLTLSLSGTAGEGTRPRRPVRSPADAGKGGGAGPAATRLP
jgi:hypothetical protein